jgi:hypothetical protein
MRQFMNWSGSGIYEPRRDLRDDSVTIDTQFANATGSPINQRECSGFNWPEFPIPAEQPINV